MNLSFHRYGERVGGESGVNSSGKVRRFSFWAMQVRRLAFARLRRVRSESVLKLVEKETKIDDMLDELISSVDDGNVVDKVKEIKKVLEG